MQRNNHAAVFRKWVPAATLGLLMVTGQSCGRASTTPNSPVPNARMVCDGSTDDTRALNTLLQIGGRVDLPSGVCVVDGASFANGVIDLHGSTSQPTTLRLPAGSRNDILRLVNVTGTIGDLGFDQRGAVGDSAGLRINGAHNLVARNLRIANPNNYGALFHSCTQCTLDGLSSTGGGTSGAWIVAFLEGRDNTVRNVSSVNAVNRTLVMELETGALVENISAKDGVAQTVLFDRTSHSVGRNWSYVNDSGKGLDDAFALIGKSEFNRIENVVAKRPAGFGFTFAAQTKPEVGAPRFNEVYNIQVTAPGQQILSFTDDGANVGPYCNVVTNLIGTNPNQQAGGNFPAIDFFGARQNAVFGRIISSDRRMTYGIVEVDHEAGSGGNLFAGQSDPGADGTVRLAAKDRSTRIMRPDPEGAANPRSRMACLQRGL